ncbi:hypothetical protein SynBMKMC1_02265 [Synechococcus sp. BMK-MC-1]|nr:hypothetical protein SynBMKMC1_02265 [Synechococcus sp. BMK-MC-1]
MRCWISWSLGEEAMPPVAGLAVSDGHVFADQRIAALY